jgi:hypothetical protein
MKRHLLFRTALFCALVIVFAPSRAPAIEGLQGVTALPLTIAVTAGQTTQATDEISYERALRGIVNEMIERTRGQGAPDPVEFHVTRNGMTKVLYFTAIDLARHPRKEKFLLVDGMISSAFPR